MTNVTYSNENLPYLPRNDRFVTASPFRRDIGPPSRNDRSPKRTSPRTTIRKERKPQLNTGAKILQKSPILQQKRSAALTRSICVNSPFAKDSPRALPRDSRPALVDLNSNVPDLPLKPIVCNAFENKCDNDEVASLRSSVAALRKELVKLRTEQEQEVESLKRIVNHQQLIIDNLLAMNLKQ